MCCIFLEEDFYWKYSVAWFCKFAHFWLNRKPGFSEYLFLWKRCLIWFGRPQPFHFIYQTQSAPPHFNSIFYIVRKGTFGCRVGFVYSIEYFNASQHFQAKLDDFINLSNCTGPGKILTIYNIVVGPGWVV